MRTTVLLALATLVGCGSAATPLPSASPTQPTPESATPAPSASATPAEAAPTAANLWADCNLLRAVAWRLEAQEHARGSANDGPAARRWLEQRAKDYSALTLHHPDGISLRAEYQGHYMSAVSGIEQAWRELEEARGDAVQDAQSRVLALQSSEEPDRAAARVCPVERPAGEPSRRVLCAELAAAGYEGLRWALFDNKDLVGPLRTRIESLATDAKAESFAERFRRHTEALAAAHRRFVAAATMSTAADADERNALMPGALADLQSQLRGSCGGDMP